MPGGHASGKGLALLLQCIRPFVVEFYARGHLKHDRGSRVCVGWGIPAVFSLSLVSFTSTITTTTTTPLTSSFTLTIIVATIVKGATATCAGCTILVLLLVVCSNKAIHWEVLYGIDQV